MNINRYAAVEIRAFGQGMQKLFEGVAEVFAAIGAEEPDRLALEKAKWKHAADGVAENKSGANEGEHTHEKEKFEARPDGSDYDDNHIDMAAVPENDPVMKEAKAAEKVAEAAGNAEHEEPEKDKKAVKKGKTAQSSVSQDDITKIIVQKIKQNRNNNEKIGQLLKTYGAARVGDLPADKYEAFITDLSAI